MPFHPECSHHFNAHSGTFTLAPRTLAPNHDIASAVQHAGRRRLCASPTSPADIPGERRGNCHSVPVRVGNGRQIFVNRHSRQLASRERVGRFSRGIAWDLITSFARRHWIILLAALFLPIVAFLPLFFLEYGAARWITVGAAGPSGSRGLASLPPNTGLGLPLVNRLASLLESSAVEWLASGIHARHR